jgi:cell division protein FtsB
MRNRLIRYLSLIFCVILGINLVRSWVQLGHRGDIIKETKDKLQEEVLLQDNLVRKLAGIKSPEFVEKQAREKLNLGKAGEIMIILPSISPIAEPTPTPVDTSSNLEKWIKVFF